MDQIFAQLATAALRDPEELRPAYGGRLPRHQAEPSRHVARSRERRCRADGCQQGRRIDRADPGHAAQPARGLVGPGIRGELLVERADPTVELGPLRAHVLNQEANARAERVSRAVVNRLIKPRQQSPAALGQ